MGWRTEDPLDFIFWWTIALIYKLASFSYIWTFSVAFNGFELFMSSVHFQRWLDKKFAHAFNEDITAGFGSDVCCFGPLVCSRLTWSLKLRPTDLSISFCCYCPCDEEIELNTLFQVKWGAVATLTKVSLSRSSTCPFPPYIVLINLVVVSWAITPLFNKMSCMWGFIVQLRAVSHK